LLSSGRKKVTLAKNDVYEIWAPSQGPWSPWVKPVVFAFMDGVFSGRTARNMRFKDEWVPRAGTTALVIDLPCEDGVLWGIHLAALGYRPVPLYNALPFPMNEKMSPPALKSVSTVNVAPILAALHEGASALARVNLAIEAPPAFLLDSDRTIARADIVPGIFDNRSVCFPTDFPSSTFLVTHGIRDVIVVSNNSKISEDLKEILFSWQRDGIRLLARYRDNDPVPLQVKQASFVRILWRRLTIALGLRRGELGGFGRVVSSSSG
jgi:hypothetical protein